MSWAFVALPLYVKAELREMTKRLEIRDRVVVRSSVRPSLKYSCSGSWLILTKGRTRREGLSGSGKAGDGKGEFTSPRPWAVAVVSASLWTRYTRTGLAMFLTVCSPRDL